MNCQFVKDKGGACKARTVKNGEFCFFHNPDSKQERELAVRTGGLNSRKNALDLPQRVIKTPDDVVLVLEETLNHLRAGNIHPNYSNSIFIGCNILLKAYGQAEIVKRDTYIKDLLNIPY